MQFKCLKITQDVEEEGASLPEMAEVIPFDSTQETLKEDFREKVVKPIIEKHKKNNNLTAENLVEDCLMSI